MGLSKVKGVQPDAVEIVNLTWATKQNMQHSYFLRSSNEPDV